VTVGVGEFADKLEWLPKLVQLKSLEKSEMFIGYTPEESVAILREAIWRAFKRKLDAIRNAALVILLPKSTGQVVQCITQAARTFANDNTDFSGVKIARFWKDLEPLLIGGENRIGVNDILAKPLQMFLCPREE
jgi:hypothetical protein